MQIIRQDVPNDELFMAFVKFGKDGGTEFRGFVTKEDIDEISNEKIEETIKKESILPFIFKPQETMYVFIPVVNAITVIHKP